MHYRRVWKHGNLDVLKIRGGVEKRLDAYSKILDDGCILWMGARNNGYGVMSYHYKVEYVHKVVWTLKNGKVPKDMQINHKCGNPSCINIDHLELGTQSERMKKFFAEKRLIKNG